MIGINYELDVAWCTKGEKDVTCLERSGPGGSGSSGAVDQVSAMSVLLRFDNLSVIV